MQTTGPIDLIQNIYASHAMLEIRKNVGQVCNFSFSFIVSLRNCWKVFGFSLIIFNPKLIKVKRLECLDLYLDNEITKFFYRFSVVGTHYRIYFHYFQFSFMIVPSAYKKLFKHTFVVLYTLQIAWTYSCCLCNDFKSRRECLCPHTCLAPNTKSGIESQTLIVFVFIVYLHA